MKEFIRGAVSNAIGVIILAVISRRLNLEHLAAAALFV